jgi:cold shock CspA family protein
MRNTGTINVWFQDRNYGFVHEEKAGVILSHFLHAQNIKAGTPYTGAEVRFKSVVSRKGLLAVDAEVLDGGSN